MIIPLTLAYAVILINGWTDAPNSIATAVASRAISYKKATLLCAFFNFIGVIFAGIFSSSVAKFVFSLGDYDSYVSLGISVVFLTMLLFGVISWLFGLPSSESHAMITAMSGTSLAVSKVPSGLKSVGYVFVFMIFSCILAFVLSLVIKRLFVWSLPYKKLQLLSCSLTSFMHGWQSGLKFVGIIAFLLNINILTGKIPPFIIISISVALSLGALLGGKRIIESMGDNLVKLSHSSAFFSDISTYLTLLICSLLGMPVSTGNIKCLAIMGVGNKGSINKKTATKLIISFIAVFPICFIISYALMKMLMLFCH